MTIPTLGMTSPEFNVNMTKQNSVSTPLVEELRGNGNDNRLRAVFSSSRTVLVLRSCYHVVMNRGFYAGPILAKPSLLVYC